MGLAKILAYLIANDYAKLLYLNNNLTVKLKFCFLRHDSKANGGQYEEECFGALD